MLRVNVDSLEGPSQGEDVLQRGNGTLGQTKADKGISVLAGEQEPTETRDVSGFSRRLGVQGDDKQGAETAKC